MVKMKTLVDSLHISNVSSDNLAEGTVIEVGETEAKQLEDRGHAERVGGSAKAVNADAVASDRPDTRDELDAERGATKAPIGVAAAPATRTAPAKPARRK